VLWEKGVREATLATGGSTPVEEIVDHYGYRDLVGEYGLSLLDLNTDESVQIPAFNDRFEVQMVDVSRTATESWVVSVCPMKTHDSLVVTLGVKNVLLGAISGGHVRKERVHCGHKAFNLSMTRMIQDLGPDLTVIDGIVGMQGDGPVFGYAIDSGVVLAAADRIAADIVGLQVMGFEPSQVGYLWYSSHVRGVSADDIEVVGETVDACRTQYEPHSTYADQLDWPIRHTDWRSVFSRADQA